MYFKATHKTITSSVSEALMVPLVIIIKLYWICILLIFMDILGIDFWKQTNKGGNKTKSIIPIQFYNVYSTDIFFIPLTALNAATERKTLCKCNLRYHCKYWSYHSNYVALWKLNVASLTEAAKTLTFFKAFRFTICQRSLINLIIESKTMSTGFMFFHFFSSFMSTLNIKISIRISAAINLFLDYFTMLWVPACPAAATPAQAGYLRGCATCFVCAARHSPMEPPEAHSVQRRCQAADQLLEQIVALPFCLYSSLPILGLDDFTLA